LHIQSFNAAVNQILNAAGRNAELSQSELLGQMHCQALQWFVPISRAFFQSQHALLNVFQDLIGFVGQGHQTFCFVLGGFFKRRFLL